MRTYIRDCGDCGTEVVGRNFCGECIILRRAEQSRRANKRWRHANPATYREQRMRRARRKGTMARADRTAELRKRADAIVPKILPLLEQGASYSQVAPRFGLSRCAVAGLVHRYKLRQQEVRND